MPDAIAPLVIPNPLRALHEQREAEFQPYAELEIVSTFGQPQAEYAAVRKGAAIIDQPQRGILELTGADRLSFINNLLTNQTWSKQTKTGLASGQGVYAFFLNGKGRVVVDVNVIERGDRTLLEMDARLVESTREAFDKFLFREQVKMTSRLGHLHSFALHGPQAPGLLADLGAGTAGGLTQLASVEVQLGPAEAVIWRDDMCAVPGFQIIVDSANAERLWTDLLATHHDAADPARRRLRPMGWAAYNAARIEGGRPIFGVDFDNTVLPAETGQLDRAVSFTKGCYLGQEIVARMHARQQVARQIVGLRVEADALPVAGTLIYDDSDNQVGGVTSSTVSPVLSNACLALALVKKPFMALGSTVNVPAEGAMRKATVVRLPFLPPAATPAAATASAPGPG